MPGWRNGIRTTLKMSRPKGSVGSSPTPGTSRSPPPYDGGFCGAIAFSPIGYNKSMVITLQEGDSLCIRRGVHALREGGVIAFPTETTYGIGCDPRNNNAVRRIFRLKGRDPVKTLLLVASSFKQAESVAIIEGPARELAKKYWPGPLTLVLPVRKDANLARGAFVAGTVAIRVSSSPIVQRLTHAFGFPIVATSANRTGEQNNRSSAAVRELFGERVDVILDGGTLPLRSVSTLARVDDDGNISVLRKGAIRLPSRIHS